MFDSKLTHYDIVDATPYHKDPMKPLADAVRAQGMKFCFYYSVPDWHDRDFPQKYSQHGFHGDPDPNADLDKYVDYVKGQVRELLTNYGPIGIIWFDGGGAFGKDAALKAKLMHAQEIIDEIHQLQPDCLVNNRLGLPGDYGTPEQKIPGAKSDEPFEVCMTLNKHWGYNKHDHNWKDETVVVRNLADIASKGGNYLLNVGPTSEGLFPQPAVDILERVGRWMKVNGESIYGTTASPLDAAPPWGRVTQKGKMLYLHVFDWPSDGKLELKGVTGGNAWLLADRNRAGVKAEAAGGGVTITLPGAAPDAADSVVVLERQ
jgi:alpha-L-fucosidase